MSISLRKSKFTITLKRSAMNLLSNLFKCNIIESNIKELSKNKKIYSIANQKMSLVSFLKISTPLNKEKIQGDFQ